MMNLVEVEGKRNFRTFPENISKIYFCQIFWFCSLITNNTPRRFLKKNIYFIVLWYSNTLYILGFNSEGATEVSWYGLLFWIVSAPYSSNYCSYWPLQLPPDFNLLKYAIANRKFQISDSVLFLNYQCKMDLGLSHPRFGGYDILQMEWAHTPRMALL